MRILKLNKVAREQIGFIGLEPPDDPMRILKRSRVSLWTRWGHT